MEISIRQFCARGSSLVALAIAGVAFSQPAMAQTASQQSNDTRCPDGSVPSAGTPCPAPTTDEPAQVQSGPAALPQAGAVDDKEIVVTGSRIARRGTETSSPIGVIDSKEIETRGFTTVAQALNEQPSFGVPGASPVGFNQSSFGAGQSFVDFLGLGSQRTLTLVNGRRFVSSNTSSIFGPTGSGGSQVDLNNIPTKLIDRVETVAAIGAPVYGSDAIAGTINIILKNNYEGLDVDAQYGLASRGDAPDYRFRLLAGKNFAGGRGNITVAGEYNEAKGLLYTDRKVSTSDDRFGTPADASSPYSFVPYTDYRVPSIATTGIPLVGGAAYGLDLPLSPQQANLFLGDPTASFGVQNAAGQTLRFNGAGALEPINFGSTIGPDDNFSVFTSGGNGLSLRSLENLQTDVKRYNANATGSFEITPDVRLFGEAWYSVSQGRNLISQPAYNSGLFGAAGTRDGDLIVPLSNPYLSASARAAIQEQINDNPLSDQNFLGVANQDYFYFGRANTDLEPGVSTAKNEILRFVGGVDGTLHVLRGRDWKFEASFNYGRAKTTSRNPELNEINFLNAINATTDASGNIVCAPGYTNSPVATLSSTCAPLNLFGNNVSEAAREYVTTIAKPVNLNQQYDAIASVAGPLIKLPGGDFAFALGYEHRAESSSFDPGVFYRGASTDLYPGDFDGDGDPVDLYYGRSVPILPVYGRYHTNEVFGELNADVISPENDVRFVHSLSFNSAGRYVWNSIAGGDFTWTVGGRFAPISSIAFRGAFTRAIRAPSITEAFNPRSSAFVFATDVCDKTLVGLGPDPATRTANCQAAGIPANFSSLSNQRSFQGYVFGNADLQNEKSNSFTAGIVLTPSFLRGFSATVDYVDIKLKNAISEFSTDQVVAACYDSADYPTNQFCGLLSRDAGTHQLNSVGTSYFNSAQLRYKGILADVSYKVRTPFLGADSGLGFSLSYQYLDTLTNQVGEGDVPIQLNDTVGYSPQKGVATVTYANGGFSFQTEVQYIGTAKIDPQDPANTYSINKINSVAFVDLSASYDVDNRFTIRASVDNVLDTKPPSPYPLSGGDFTYFSGILGTFIRIGAAVHF